MSLRSLVLEVRGLEGLYDSIVSRSPGQSRLAHVYWRHFPRHVRILRETLFVRLVSALEVFRHDVLRLILIVRKDLLNRPDPISFTAAEIIGTGSLEHLIGRLVDDEVSRISEQGLDGFVSFMQQKAKLNFGSCPTPLPTLKEMLERRNLIVHRLGVTDANYRKRYSDVSSRLAVDEAYLRAAFRGAVDFARFVDRGLQRIVAAPSLEERRNGIRMAVIEVSPLTSAGDAAISATHEVVAGDGTFVLLSDLLIGNVGRYERVMVLRGERKYIDKYEREVQSLHDRKQLILVRWNKLSLRRYKDSFDRATLDAVRVLLPERPWPADLHKSIASQLGISRKHAYSAIYEIIFGYADELLNDA